MKWVTADIVTAIKNLPGIRDVTVHPPGGDHDTDVLHVTVEGTDGVFWVRGFDPESDYVPNRDTSMWDVPMAELNDGIYEDVAMSSNDEEAALAHVRIRKYLIRRGLAVVGFMNPYF